MRHIKNFPAPFQFGYFHKLSWNVKHTCIHWPFTSVHQHAMVADGMWWNGMFRTSKCKLGTRLPLVCILSSAVATETVISRWGRGGDVQKETIAGQAFIDTRSSSVKDHMQNISIPTDEDKTHLRAIVIVHLVYQPKIPLWKEICKDSFPEQTALRALIKPTKTHA